MLPFAAIIPEHALQSLVTQWLTEDSSCGFDVGAVCVGTSPATAVLYAKSSGIVCGIPFFDAVMTRVGCVARWEPGVVDGYEVNIYNGKKKKVVLGYVEGPAASLLRGERVALNALAECSGMATAAHRAVQISKRYNWRGSVAMTRKTTPGFRLVQKYAGIVGGIDPHRYGLSSMVMLKDNHVVACGGNVETAIKQVRKCGGFAVKVEVECGTLEEGLVAAKHGADVAMLDNMKPAEFKECAVEMKRAHPNVLIEGSGGLNFDTIGDYMIPEADILSFSINRFASPVDMSLKITQ